MNTFDINLFLTLVAAIISIVALVMRYFYNKKTKSNKLVPKSVNFHFTRKCNYECGFCFHTAKTSHLTKFDAAKRGLLMVKNAGMLKINFSGGEPFLYPKYLGELVKYCKEDLNLESVSIVSNGSKITEAWFQKHAKYLDILAISVDSFNEEANIKIGRGKGKHLAKLFDIRDWCTKYNVLYKLNTVVNVYNYDEDMVAPITQLRPFRWKVFQCLLVDTENAGMSAIRKAESYLISDKQYEQFCSKHRNLPCFVPESNDIMKESYIILDEYMRFLNKGDVYAESESILEVGVEKAIQQVDFDIEKFNARGGIYNWTKERVQNGRCNNNDMEW